MSSSKNPEKGEIVLLLESSSLLAVDVVRSKALSLKSRCSREINSVSSRLPAEPITDEVRVAGPDDGLHSGFDDVGELG